MAFDINDIRHSNWLPFTHPVASPTHFEGYFTKLPRCLDPMTDVFVNDASNSKNNTPKKSGLAKFGGNILAAAQSMGNEYLGKIIGTQVKTNVRFRVQTAELPSVNVDHKPRMVHGPMRNIPLGLQYPTISLEIIENDQFDMRNFFELWLSRATGKKFTPEQKSDIKDGNMGMLKKAASTLKNIRGKKSVKDEIPEETSSIISARYEPIYYSDVVGEFTIVLYGRNGLPQGKVTFYEAYPISLSPTSLSWSSTDSYIINTVELSYKEWYFEQLDIADAFTDPVYTDAIARGLVNAVMGSVGGKVGSAIDSKTSKILKF